MRVARLVLLSVLFAAGCGSVPRFVMHPVGRGVDLPRLQELHRRYARPIVVLAGEVYVPDWGCVCDRTWVAENRELVDPRGDRLVEDVVADPLAEAGEDGVAPPGPLRLQCHREEDDVDVFRLSGEFVGTAYVFDGQRLLPAPDRVVSLVPAPEAVPTERAPGARVR